MCHGKSVKFGLFLLKSAEKCCPNINVTVFLGGIFNKKAACFSCNSHWHSVIKTRKNIFKISLIPLVRNKTFPTFAPAFREGACSLKRASRGTAREDEERLTVRV